MEFMSLVKMDINFYMKYDEKIILNPFSQRQISCIIKDMGWKILSLLELKE